MEKLEASSQRRPKGDKPSTLQKAMLADFLEANPELARGRLEGPDASRRASNLWRINADRFNASGGCIKTWKEWRKFWNDKKIYIKALAAKRQRYALSRGDGPAANIGPLGEWEERVLAVMGDGFGKVDTEVAVPPVPVKLHKNVVVPDAHPEDFDVIESSPDVLSFLAEAPVSPSQSPPPLSPPSSPQVGERRRGRPPTNQHQAPPTPARSGYRELLDLIVEQDRARAVDAQHERELMRQLVEQTQRIADLFERFLHRHNY